MSVAHLALERSWIWRGATCLAMAATVGVAACGGDSTGPSFEDDEVRMMVGPAGGTAVTPSGHAGAQVPPGAFDAAVELVIERIPRPVTIGDGPLPTTLPQYPEFYDFRVPVEPRLPVLVGVCVVDPPDPLAPDPAVVPRLRLAHTDPDAPQSVEVLPVTPAPFLDCSSALARGSRPGSVWARVGRRLRALMATPLRADAAPGGLGGLASTFSPFGAVDAGASFNDPPRILTLQFPATIGNALGQTGSGPLSFRDPDADIVLVRIDEVADPENAWTAPPSVTFDPGIQGTVEGTITLTTTCTGTGPCPTGGPVTLGVTLEDAAGNTSNAVEITFDVIDTAGGTSPSRGPAGTPAIDRRRPPR